jgi:hypothetical protein
MTKSVFGTYWGFSDGMLKGFKGEFQRGGRV